MNPLDANTPAELFGEAVADARTLKRAYAALVRAFPPEQEPSTFAHIRRMYELAREGVTGAPVDAGRAAPSTDGAPQASVGSAAHAEGVTEERDVDAVLAAFDPQDWRATVDALRHRARSGDPQAVPAGYGLLVALDPDAAIRWLTDLVDVPELVPAIADAVAATFSIMEERSRDPALDDLLAALPSSLGLSLRSFRLQAMAPFHPARAASIWERELAALAVEPELVRGLLLQAFGTIRWHLDEPSLRGVLALVDDARFELSDADVALVRAGAFAALAARTDDGPCALPIYRALQAGHRAAPAQAASALRDLVAELPDPVRDLRALERSAPGSVGALNEMVDRVSGYDSALFAWAIAGEPIPPADRASRWLDEIDAEVEAALADERTRCPEVGDGRGPDIEELRSTFRPGPAEIAAGLLFMGAAIFAALGLPSLLFGFAQRGLAQLTLAGLLVALAFGARLVGPMLTSPSRASSAPERDAAWERVVHEAVRRAGLLGYWPHEVAGALHLRRDPSAWLPLSIPLGEPAFTLAAITDAHVRRLVAAEAAEARAAEVDAAEHGPAPLDEDPP